jgi:hypothetical protein
MTEEEKKELKAIVREVLDEVMSEVKPMPVPVSSGPVTEISIRVMPSGAIETLGVGHVGGYPYPFACWPCPPPTTPCLAAMVPTDEKSVKLLQHIVDTTGEGQEEVIRKLGNRIMGKQLAEEIERYAEEVQQDKEGEK